MRHWAITMCIGILTATIGLLGCGSKQKGQVIRNTGSDTLVNVAQRWSEAYREVLPGVSVEVSGGGSGVGINALIKGDIDIANASRDMTAAEKKKIHDKTGKDPVEHVVGYDALAVYVHKDNPVKELTIEQLAAIFVKDGAVTKWSQIGVTIPGGSDEIVVVGRQNSSGTYQFFNEHVLDKKDFRPEVKQMSGSKDVVELVGKTRGAIGYSGMGYKSNDVRFVSVSKAAGEKAYEPSEANVIASTYPLKRSLLMYTLADPPAQVQEYIKWIKSPKGQAILAEIGFVRIPSADGPAKTQP